MGTRVCHVLLPLALLLERLRQGCRPAIEFPPAVSGPAADLPQQDVCLQLAVDAAFAAPACLRRSAYACSGSLERVCWYTCFRSEHSRSKKGLCCLHYWPGSYQLLSMIEVSPSAGVSRSRVRWTGLPHGGKRQGHGCCQADGQCPIPDRLTGTIAVAAWHGPQSAGQLGAGIPADKQSWQLLRHRFKL